jgi:hypothetical protein
MKRNLKAVDLVKAIQQHGVITGYAVAGRLAGEENAQARDWGQVCSLVDYACFIAGLPPLTLQHVRTADGEIKDCFSAPFLQYEKEMVQLAQSFVWTEAHFAKLVATLLADCADLNAHSAWDAVIKREAKQPGFIRYQLDRAIRAAA